MSVILVLVGVCLIASAVILGLAIYTATTLECPICKSKNVSEVNGSDSFECHDCGTKWK